MIDNLSNDARALALGSFIRGARLTYRMEKYGPSPRATAALTELEQTGLIRQEADGKAITWRANTELLDYDPDEIAGNRNALAFMLEHGNFNLTEPLPA